MSDEFEPEEELSGFAEDTRMVRMDSIQPDGAGPAGNISVEPLPADLSPRLEITAGPESGTTHYIRKPLVILGRVADVADLVVPSNTASRHHAAIGYSRGEFTLYDMGSTNGTLVNGQRITERKIVQDDEIKIGDNIFTFKLD